MSKVGTLPIVKVLEIFDRIYEDELAANFDALKKGAFAAWSGADLETRVAAKIYTHCTLSTLLELAKKEYFPPAAMTTEAIHMAVIGRGDDFYLPNERDRADTRISRINTGFIFIPRVGYFVIDLGGACGATVKLNNGESVELIFKKDSAEIKTYELENVRAIQLVTGAEILKADFPSQELGYPCLVRAMLPGSPDQRKQMELQQFHNKVANQAREFVLKIKDLAPTIKEQLIGKTEEISIKSVSYGLASMLPRYANVPSSSSTHSVVPSASSAPTTPISASGSILQTLRATPKQPPHSPYTPLLQPSKAPAPVTSPSLVTLSPTVSILKRDPASQSPHAVLDKTSHPRPNASLPPSSAPAPQPLKVQRPAAQILPSVAHAKPMKRPKEHFCPITQEVMQDPVIAADGHSYDKEAITRWFSEREIPTSPLTNLRLPSTVLTPNIALKNVIQDWKGDDISLHNTSSAKTVSPHIAKKPVSPPYNPTLFADADLKKPVAFERKDEASAPPLPSSVCSSSQSPPPYAPLLMRSSEQMTLPLNSFNLPVVTTPKKRNIFFNFSGWFDGTACAGSIPREEHAEALRAGLNTALRFTNYSNRASGIFKTTCDMLKNSTSKASLKERCEMVIAMLSALWLEAKNQSYPHVAKEQKQFCLNFIAILNAQHLTEDGFDSALESFSKRINQSQSLTVKKAF
jgi:hypothetical protein